MAVEEFRILVECNNDFYVAKTFIQPELYSKIKQLGLDVAVPEPRHGGNRTEIIERYMKGEVRASILIVDYDYESNWPREHKRKVLDKAMPLVQTEADPLHDVLHVIDQDARCLILIIRRELEDWISRRCGICSNPDRIKPPQRFQKLCRENEHVRSLLKRFAGIVANFIPESLSLDSHSSDHVPLSP